MKKYNYIISIISIISIVIILIISLYYLDKNIIVNKNTINSLNNCVSYDNQMSRCISDKYIIYQEESSQVIERKTLKSILNNSIKYKLMNLDSIFIPSMMYGTFCNKVYTTYYDFKNGHFNSTINTFLKENKVKRVRIRHYYFDPNSYFEIKYKDHKIRILIDCQYNILEEIPQIYRNIIPEILYQIKKGEIPELFYNEYKRFSFIYKTNQSIRMTIDTDISIKHQGKTHLFPFDILEVKYNNISTETILTYFKQIENNIHDKIKLSDFSKVDYTIENIVIPYKEKEMLQNIRW